MNDFEKAVERAHAGSLSAGFNYCVLKFEGDNFFLVMPLSECVRRGFEYLYCTADGWAYEFPETAPKAWSIASQRHYEAPPK